MQPTSTITLAWTGASGAVYGLRLLQALMGLQQRVDLLISDAARVVLRQECGLDLQGDGVAVVQALGDYFRRHTPGVDLSGLRHFAKA